MSHDVAIFASSFHPHLGGVEELVRQLAHAQQSAGGRPLVVTMKWPKSLPSCETFEGLEVRRHVFRLPERKARWLAAYAVEARSIQRSIDAQLRAHGTNLIHVQCVSGNGLYAARAAKHLGLPLVVSLQGELSMDADRVYERSTVLPKLLGRLLRDADAVTACSAHTLAEAEEFTGVRLGARGSVIHNGVDIDEFDAAVPEHRARPYMLAIGRHVAQKGFDVLLDAYARFSQSQSVRPALVLAGDGPERTALIARARRLGIESDVDFVGRVDRPRTAALFRGCAFFILPSLHEPQGIVVLEAMAAQKAVIATRVGGVPEIVTHGETGLLVPPGDAVELAEAMERLTQGQLVARLGQAGRLRAEKLAWQDVMSQYGELYSRVGVAGRR